MQTEATTVVKPEVITYPITVRTRPVDNHKSKTRTYDAQVLFRGDVVQFYIMSKTRRGIFIDDHFDIKDIISINFGNHTYQTLSVDTMKIGKEHMPVIDTVCIA